MSMTNIEKIERIYNKTGERLSIELSDKDLEYHYQKIFFPWRANKINITNIKECEDCGFREIIFGNVVCLNSTEQECVNSNFKYHEKKYKLKRI